MSGFRPLEPVGYANVQNQIAKGNFNAPPLRVQLNPNAENYFPEPEGYKRVKNQINKGNFNAVARKRKSTRKNGRKQKRRSTRK